MMRRAHWFSAVHDECSGEAVWCSRTFADRFNDGDTLVGGDARVMAHDMLEHSALHLIGPVADEFRANGAAWYIRGEERGFHGRAPGLLGDITCDAQHNFETWLGREGGGLAMLPEGRGRPADWATAVAEGGFDMLRAERGEDMDAEDLEPARVAIATLRAARLLTAGYRGAAKRYPNQQRAGDFFDEVVGVLDDCAAFKNPCDFLGTGERLCVRLDYDKFTVEVFSDGRY